MPTYGVRPRCTGRSPSVFGNATGTRLWVASFSRATRGVCVPPLQNHVNRSTPTFSPSSAAGPAVRRLTLEWDKRCKDAPACRVAGRAAGRGSPSDRAASQCRRFMGNRLVADDRRGLPRPLYVIVQTNGGCSGHGRSFAPWSWRPCGSIGRRVLPPKSPNSCLGQEPASRKAGPHTKGRQS